MMVPKGGRGPDLMVKLRPVQYDYREEEDNRWGHSSPWTQTRPFDLFCRGKNNTEESLLAVPKDQSRFDDKRFITHPQ